MHLTDLLRRRSRSNSLGENILSSSQFATKCTEHRMLLRETTLDYPNNQRICEQIMSELQLLHVKKDETFLYNLSNLLREVYTHANFNMEQLLYEGTKSREETRITYWRDIVRIFDKIFEVMNVIWDSETDFRRLPVIVSYAALFSLYKDVASTVIMDYCFRIAHEINDWADNDKSIAYTAEKIKIKEHYEMIHLIYVLRNQIPEAKQLNDSDTPEKEVQTKDQATESHLVIPAIKVENPQAAKETEEKQVQEAAHTDQDQDYTINTIPQTNNITTTTEAEMLPSSHYYDDIMDCTNDEHISDYLADEGTVDNEKDIGVLHQWADQLTQSIFEQAGPELSKIFSGEVREVTYDHYEVPHHIHQRNGGKEGMEDDQLKETHLNEQYYVSDKDNHENHNYYEGGPSNTQMLSRLTLESSTSGASSELTPFDPLSILEQKQQPERTVEIPVITKKDLVNSFRRRALFDTPQEKKRISESECEARDSKGARKDGEADMTGDMDEVFDEAEDEEFYTTPANSPQQQTQFHFENREIQSGVFEGIQIPLRVSETPQNTPMSECFKPNPSQHSQLKDLEAKIIRAVINEKALTLSPLKNTAEFFSNSK